MKPQPRGKKLTALRQMYMQKTEQALDAQRRGALKLYFQITAEAELILDHIEELAEGRKKGRSNS